MVGIRRSKACGTCSRRSVKCDETRPFCKRCEKAEIQCLGYSKDLPFVHEAPKLHRKYGHDQPTILSQGIHHKWPSDATIVQFEPVHSDGLAIQNSKQSDEPPSLSSRTANEDKSHDFRPVYPDNDFKLHIYCPQLQQAQLFSILIRGLSQGTEPLLSSPMQSYRHWSSYLFPLAGNHSLLDASIRAASLAYIGRQQEHEKLRTESRPYYNQALRYLSATLKSEGTYISCETLSATVLLSFCEIFLADKQHSWVRHAGGAGALMRIRGPVNHRHGFGREIFLLYRNYLIVEAFFQKTACFISKPDWLRLSQQICTDLYDGDESVESEIFRFYTSLTEENSKVTGLLHDARNLISHAQTLGGPKAARDDLVLWSRDCLNRIDAIFAALNASLEKHGFSQVSIDSHDPLIPIYYIYVNSTVAAAYCSSSATTIFLNQLIQEVIPLRHTDPRIQEVCYQAAVECCRSVGPLLGNHTFTQFFSYMPLRLSLVALPPDSKEAKWIWDKLLKVYKGYEPLSEEKIASVRANPRPGIRKAVKELETLEAGMQSKFIQGNQ